MPFNIYAMLRILCKKIKSTIQEYFLLKLNSRIQGILATLREAIQKKSFNKKIVLKGGGGQLRVGKFLPGGRGSESKYPYFF